jgi:antibiotic biosynthesis monooxygenase (ABM) superfamily enzyme
MSVKILIQRKVKPGKDHELNAAVRELRSLAIHAPGYISGETLRSVEDPSIHLVISTWSEIDDWNRWANSPERKAFEKKIAALLQAPTSVACYRYEAIAPSMDDILTGLEASVQDE